MSIKLIKISVIDNDEEEKKVHKFHVLIQPVNLWIWLPYQTISKKDKILDYYIHRIEDLSKMNSSIYETSDKIFELLWRCDRSELDSLRREYLTIKGLQLPPSSRCGILKRIKRILKDPSLIDPNYIRKLRKDVLLERLIEERTQLLANLKVCERQLNVISDNYHYIRITNDVDLEMFPTDLIYINQYSVMSKDFPSDAVAIKCECEDKSTCITNSCYHYFRNSELRKRKTKVDVSLDENQIDDSNPYDEKGRILYNRTSPVFECNDYCACDEKCSRRIVQNGANLKLEIFRTWNGCGWGVRTLEDIPSRTFVCRYTGEVITWNEGVKRGGEYLFDLDFDYDRDLKHCPYTVDAHKYGNISRFINHCCDSNINIYCVYINNINPEMPVIAFFTKRDIEAGEELSINYRKLIKAMKYKCRCAKCYCESSNV